MNLGGTLLMRDKLDEASSALEEAWTRQAGRHDLTSARILLLLAVAAWLLGQM